MRYRNASVTFVAIALAGVVSVAASADNIQDQVVAVWRPQSLAFQFHGSGVAYSCDAFKKNVRDILMDVGAHPSVVVQTTCPISPERIRGGTQTVLPQRFSARIELATPVIATAENIEQIAAVDSQQALIARVQGTDLPTAKELPRFHAVWVARSVRGAADGPLVANDCELLRQLNEQIFPKIGVHVTKTKLICSSNTMRRPLVEVIALMSVEQLAEIAQSR